MYLHVNCYYSEGYYAERTCVCRDTVERVNRKSEKLRFISFVAVGLLCNTTIHVALITSSVNQKR